MNARNSNVPGQTPAPGFQMRNPWGRMAAAVLFFALVLAVCRFSPNPNSSLQAGVRMQLPDFYKGMTATDLSMTAAEQKILPTDTGFVRKLYKDPAGDQIACTIVLAGGEKRSIHRPEVCLPGQGWNIKSGEVAPITLSDGRRLEVMKLTLEQDVQIGPGHNIKRKCLFLYWFVGKGVTTPLHSWRVFLTSWDRVMRNLNHRWAYVIVSSLVTDNLMPNGRNEQQTLQMLENFISDTAPTYMLEDRGDGNVKSRSPDSKPVPAAKEEAAKPGAGSR
ncbi:MAG: exosortase-associated EpsI family protein [Methylacidiphilales bacterium]|nr:exosortase-associated EpsI family protein [Candidatus Methylacidiphilales bacterium]